MSSLTPQRRAILYVEDAITYSKRAIEFLGGQSDDQLEQDLKGQFAIFRAIEVVGEAARNIPEEVRALSTDIPWSDVIAMRNRIAHHYFGVRLDVVINVVRLDLPPLIVSLEHLLLDLKRSQEQDAE